MFIAGIMDRPWLFEDSWQSPHTNQSSFISLDWSDFWQLINLCRRQFKIILGVRYKICRYHTLKTSFSDFFFLTQPKWVKNKFQSRSQFEKESTQFWRPYNASLDKIKNKNEPISNQELKEIKTLSFIFSGWL